MLHILDTPVIADLIAHAIGEMELMGPKLYHRAALFVSEVP